MDSEARRRLPGTVGWGFILWAAGHAVSMVLFFFVPAAIIGWLVSIPLIPPTVWVAYQRLHNVKAAPYYFLAVAVAWLATALILDYVFIVRAFGVENYYDLDVSIYYSLTLLIPLAVGWRSGRLRVEGPAGLGGTTVGRHEQGAG